MTASIGLGARQPAVPRVSLLLLGAAAIDGAIGFWSRQRVDAYWYENLPVVIGQLTSVMPLVIAAGIAAGWDRWPAGRAWLKAAVVAYAVSAVLEATGKVGISAALVGGEPPSQDVMIALQGSALLQTIGLTIATLLAATGLQRGRAAAMPGRWPGRITTALAILVTVAAVVTVTPVLSEIMSRGPGPADALSDAAYVLIALSSIPPALLAAVAMRRLPERHVLPELLIGVGSMTAAIAFWVMVAPILVASAWGPQVVAVGVVVTASVVQLVGLAALAAGFFAARFSPSDAADRAA